MFLFYILHVAGNNDSNHFTLAVQEKADLVLAVTYFCIFLSLVFLNQFHIGKSIFFAALFHYDLISVFLLDGGKFGSSFNTTVCIAPFTCTILKLECVVKTTFSRISFLLAQIDKVDPSLFVCHGHNGLL